MANFTEETTKKLNRMRQLYFVPIDLGALLIGLDEVRRDLPDCLCVIVDALEHSVKAITETISLPFELASANAHNHHWQRFSTAERIRAQIIDAERDEAPDSYEERKTKITAENATKKMNEFIASDEGVDAISNDLANFLLTAHDNGTICTASTELILQGAVLIWSSFEVFSRDVFIEAVNNKPTFVEMLQQDQAIRKRFDITRVPLDVLSGYGYDVSRKMGSILATQQDLSDLRTIKSVFQCLYGADKGLCNSINSDALWKLSQQRHLIVHKRGIVDSDYIRNIGENLPCGRNLQITPQDLEQYLRSVLDVVCSMVRVVKAGFVTEG